MALYYLSFAEPRPPKGRGWLGGLYIEGEDFKDAVKQSISIDQNPGGEVIGAPCQRPVDARWHNRLLTREEVRASEPSGRLIDQRGREIFDA
jgi:hypothetical protein